MENSLEIVKSFPNGRVLIIEHGEHAGIEPLAQSAPKVFAQLLDFLRTGNMTNLPERVTVPAPKFVVPDFPPPGTQPTSKAAGKE
jgi:virulence-associated protein VagC